MQEPTNEKTGHETTDQSQVGGTSSQADIPNCESEVKTRTGKCPLSAGRVRNGYFWNALTLIVGGLLDEA